jgi:hypothetical protein
MVEHFADAVMGNEALSFSPAKSVCNMRLLVALLQPSAACLYYNNENFPNTSVRTRLTCIN